MTTLNNIPQNSTTKEDIANENFKALSPGAIFSKNFSTTSGLNFGYFGGEYNKNDGTTITINNGVVSLLNNTINYIFFNLSTNAVERNNTGFLNTHIPLYEVTTLSSLITNIVDKRVIAFLPFGTPSNFYTAPYTLPVATTTTIGGVKPDNTTILISPDGTISSTGTAAGGGGGLGITSSQIILSSDVVLSKSNLFYDILTLTLTSGKYLISSNINFQRTTSTTTLFTAAIYDGTNYLANGSSTTPAATPNGTEICFSLLLTLTETKDIKLVAQTATGATTSLVKASRITGATDGATRLLALRIAD